MKKQINYSNNNNSNHNAGITHYRYHRLHHNQQQQQQQEGKSQIKMSAVSEKEELTSIWTELSSAHCLPKALLATDVSQKLSLHAPLTALGLSHKNDYSYKNTMNNKQRMRKQVGFTNRWRLPEPLGSDLLGTSQALRAISTPLNETLIRIITAESPHIAVNLDLSQPYKFRQIEDRPTTASLASPDFKKSTKTLTQVKREYSAQWDFSYCAEKNAMKPDISLHCLGVIWCLHSNCISKSSVLTALFSRPHRRTSDNNTKQGLPRKPKSAGDIHLKSSDLKPLDSRFRLHGLSRNSMDSTDDSVNFIQNETFRIDLEADDPKLTKKGLAVALGTLYQNEEELPMAKQIVPVLAAAHLLQMKDLTDKCVEVMIETVNAENLGYFYDAAIKYKLNDCVSFFEHWTELHLVPTVSKTIHLREVRRKLFEEVLFSERLFTDNEFSVYQTICYWLYFQLNPDCQCFPYSFSTLLAFFNGLTKQMSYLETNEGLQYQNLFSAVRFNGITDASHLHQIRIMNIIPRSQLVDVLCHHFDSLYCGGDMVSISEFESASIRWGVVINDREVYDPEMVFHYGFYFNLKIEKIEKTYHLYIQRLKPSVFTLSFRECERHTFSLRSERFATYSITARSFHHGVRSTYKTGVLCHTFRMEEKHSQSQELIITEPHLPLYATFAILFPRT